MINLHFYEIHGKKDEQRYFVLWIVYFDLFPIFLYQLSNRRPGCSRLLEFKKKDSTGRLIETFSKYPDQAVYQRRKIGPGSPEIKQSDQFFLRWTWSFKRDILEKFRPGCLIGQDA